MAKLIVKSQGVILREMELEKKSIVIGRKSADDIHIEDPKSSRSHAQVYYREGHYYVKDMDSRNGTRVNGRLIKDQRLSVGDVIGIGDTEILYERSREAITFQLRGYEILEHVATGGMGKVYKGRQISLDRMVAIKTLSPKLSNDDAFKNNFIREARSAGKLNHPNLVQVHDVDKEGEILYFAMEYVEGHSVKELLEKDKVISPQRTLDIVIQACSALDYVHQNKLIHRDMKPDNLIIDNEGQVKLVDLGISKSLKDKDDSAETGRVVGTPHYISPEQARGEALDGRSDIYSLGATMFHMLTGHTPFKGKTSKEILQQHLYTKAPELKAVKSDLSEELSDLVAAMLAKDPEKRPASAGELLTKLEEIREELQTRLRHTEVTILHQPKHYIILVLILGTAILGVGALVTHIVRSRLNSEDNGSSVIIENEEDNGKKGGPSDIEGLIEKCSTFEKQGDFQAALEGYREIKANYPNHSGIERVDAKIAELKRLIEDKKNDRRLEVAQNEYDEIQRFCGTNPTDLTVHKQKWADFIGKYPDIPLAASARKKIAQVNKAIKDKAVEDKFNAMDEQASKHLLRGKYKVACDVYEQFKGDVSEEEWKTKADEKIQKIMTQVETHYKEAMAKADRYEKEKDTAGALKAYMDVADMMKGFSDYTKKAREKADAMRKILTKEYESLVQKARGFTQRFRFEDAGSLLKTKVVEFMGTPWEQKIKVKAAEITRLKELHAMVVKEAAAKTSKQSVSTQFAMEVYKKMRRGTYGRVGPERVEIKYKIDLYEEKFSKSYSWKDLGANTAFLAYKTFLDERKKGVKDSLKLFVREMGVDMKQVEELKKKPE